MRTPPRAHRSSRGASEPTVSRRDGGREEVTDRKKERGVAGLARLGVATDTAHLVPAEHLVDARERHERIDGAGADQRLRRRKPLDQTEVGAVLAGHLE